MDTRAPKPLGDQEVEQSLYAKHQKVYPRQVGGIFQVLRLSGVATLMGIYYFLPWLQWGGRQAVLLDLPARKFYIFGLVFWPQDFFYLAALLVIAALSLFFFTALAGRLWCGYACPQTVWTEVFLWIERKVEGDRAARMKLDKAPWDFRKLRIKGSKHLLWFLLALWTGFTFVGYFTPIRELWHSALALSTGPWETFWILFYGFATWGNAGFMREQVCIYMCPYARFQSAMFDKDTLIITYDSARGEPRGARKKSLDYKGAGLGDCVDCSICVQVCPTGIDIRNGLQYQCIGCAACIDACDEVMDKMGYPKGLIRYTTEHALTGGKTHVVRPRVAIYAGILLLLSSGLVYGIATRTPLIVDIIRDRLALYRETGDGLIENVYTFKLINKDVRDHEYRITASGIDGLALKLEGETFFVKSGEVREAIARLQVPPENLKKPSYDVRFLIESVDGPEVRIVEKARFVGPR
jgi:cytochrome c oxidase accessory protein FixG